LFGENRVAPMICQRMLSALKRQSQSATILVIGGGAVGAGASALYEDRDIQLVGTDVYASPNTCLIADAHRLPFKDGVFDAVWVQAVLEHVLEPHVVAGEIRRVLKPGGLVYADTPFLQAVHEGAYDFTRFTLSGQRWLFRHFEQLDAGIVGGPGSSLLWALRYYFRALGLGDTSASIAVFAFFWLRLLDRFMRKQLSADAAVGTYFYGRKAERSLAARDMIDYYRAQGQALRAVGHASSARPRPASAAVTDQCAGAVRRLE
jgi:SAM-dependent methyltransferase